jgi:hypothetical protein
MEISILNTEERRLKVGRLDTTLTFLPQELSCEKHDAVIPRVGAEAVLMTLKNIWLGLEGGEEEGEVTQTICTHVSKCKNDKIKKSMVVIILKPLLLTRLSQSV